MKTLTIAGKRYRLSVRSWDGLLNLAGPGIFVTQVLPAGVALDSPDLRPQVTAALERYRQARREAGALVQQRVRDGTAGLG